MQAEKSILEIENLELSIRTMLLETKRSFCLDFLISNKRSMKEVSSDISLFGVKAKYILKYKYQKKSSPLDSRGIGLNKKILFHLLITTRTKAG